MKRIIILALIILVTISILLYFLSPRRVTQEKFPVPKSSSSPSINPTGKQISSFLKTKPGETTDQEVQKLAGLVKIEITTAGKTYHFDSPMRLRDNLITTEQGRVVFEKAISVQGDRHPLVTSYISQFGQPEATYVGHSFYGQFETTYAYPSLGFALIGNPFTYEIEEIQSFIPTTQSDYLERWGKEIQQSSPNEKFGS